MRANLQAAQDVFRMGKRSPDEPIMGWDLWAQGMRHSWDRWGLEAEGIPLDFGIVSRKGLPPLPLVRNPTQKELDGLKAGTRPDLIEKMRNYRAIVKLYLKDWIAELTAEQIRRLRKRQERKVPRLAKLAKRGNNTELGNALLDCMRWKGKPEDCPHYISDKYHHPNKSCHVWRDGIPTFDRCVKLGCRVSTSANLAEVGRLN